MENIKFEMWVVNGIDIYNLKGIWLNAFQILIALSKDPNIANLESSTSKYNKRNMIPNFKRVDTLIDVHADCISFSLEHTLA